MSQTCQVSEILPPSTRWMLTASTRTLLPVGGMPFISPTWVPLPVQRDHDAVTRREDLVDLPVAVHAPLVRGDGVGHPLRAVARGHLRVVQPVTGCEHLARDLVLPLVAHLLVETTDHCFVCS